MVIKALDQDRYSASVNFNEVLTNCQKQLELEALLVQIFLKYVFFIRIRILVVFQPHTKVSILVRVFLNSYSAFNNRILSTIHFAIQAVLRIHDILVWIRIRIWIQILRFLSLTLKTPTKNYFFSFSAFESTCTSFFKEKKEKSHNSRHQGFLTI